MILEQFYLTCLAHASYLIGDETSGTAAVIDPQRDIDHYLAFAAEHQLTIGHVILTHFHADFVAGHIELRDRTGAAIYLGAKAKAEYAFTPLAEGDAITLGSVRLVALETPGHTVESICLLVYEGNAGAPRAVLTGDTLFVGDVGRPDLRASLGWSASDLGGMLYESIHQKLLPLPDATLVYPAHGAGSLCGKAIGKETFTTIGEQRQANCALRPMSKAQFVVLVSADQPDAPPYFTYDAVLNSQERPTLDEALAREVRPLTLEELLALQSAGAEIVDTRDAIDFASAHIAGSINIGFGGQFATWAGTLLHRDRSIAIIAAPGYEREAAMRLGRIGFDQMVGYLQGGLRSAEPRPDIMATTERVSPERAAEDRAAAGPERAPLIVDVRTPEEFEATRIAGAVNVPLNHLPERMTELRRGRPILIHCASGYRSSIAASLLERDGFPAVGEIAGGLAAWEAASLPLESLKPPT